MPDGDDTAVDVDLESVREDARAAAESVIREMEKEAVDVDIQPEDVEHAKDVVLEKGLETTDFVRFRSFLLQDDYEPDEIEELWAILRNEDAIPKGSREVPAGPSGSDDSDGVEHDHDDDGGEVGAEAAIEAAAEGAESVYLLKTSNCPTCIQAEQALEGWIEDGVVSTLNFPENPRAETIVDDLGITEVPTLVAEVNDGRFREL